MPNGIKTLANPTTHHGPTSFGGGSGQGTFTYFQLAGQTGNTGANGVTIAALRVLSPTTLLVAMPLTGANPTGGNLIPIFIPAAGTYALWLGPNCEVAVNPDNTGAPFQFSTQATLPAPAPTWTQLYAPSTNTQLQFEGPAGQTVVRANGAAGTTSWSQYNR
jgi:hypothetical protein